MDLPVNLIPVRLPNGAEIRVEMRPSGEADVAAFDELPALTAELLRDTISGLADLVNTAVKTVRPHKVSIEFGVELGYEPGKLVAFVVNGSAKGNLKIHLESAPEK